VKEDLHHSYRELYKIYQLYYPDEYKRQWKEYEEKYTNYGNEESNNQEPTTES